MIFEATDWTRYGTCPMDGAKTGQPCTTRRMIARRMVDDPMRIPHTARPRLEPAFTYGAQTAHVVCEAALGTLTPDEQRRVVRALADRYGIEPRESETEK